MELNFKNGVKLVVPDGKEVSIIFNSRVVGEDRACGGQKGNAIDLMVLLLDSIEELLTVLPGPLKKHFVVAVAECLAKQAPKIDGMDVVMVKRSRREEGDDE